MLAMLIGSPMCWCCLSHSGPAVEEEQGESCPMCRTEEKPAAPQDQDGKRHSNCPCARGCSFRELTQPVVAVPAPPVLKLPPMDWVWLEGEFQPAVWAAEETIPALDTGPPRPAGPIYQVHCALLI